MDQHSRNVDESDTSISSLPYDSLGCSPSGSGSGSLVESVGSVEVESRGKQPTKERETPEARFGRPARKVGKSGPQFMQLSMEMRGVPVEALWEYVRIDRNLARLIPGVIGNFDYLEGDGGTGSVFLAVFSSEYFKPRGDVFAIHKVEVSDDESHIHAVRCVGGMPHEQYELYMLFLTVVPDEVLGDSSSVLVLRLEYELRDPQCPISEERKMVYTMTMGMIKDRCVSLHRVDRPLATYVRMAANMMRQRLRMKARQQREIGPDEEELERRRRKSTVQLVLTDDNGVDGDGKNYWRRRRSSTVDQLLGKGEEGVLERDGPSKQMARKKSGVVLLQLEDDEGVNGDGQQNGRGTSASRKLQAGESGMPVLGAGST